eukprot:243930-Amphidinium_carterae.1
MLAQRATLVQDTCPLCSAPIEPVSKEGGVSEACVQLACVQNTANARQKLLSCTVVSSRSKRGPSCKIASTEQLPQK